MHGHHHHCVVAVIVLFQIGIQGDFFQEPCQAGILRIFQIRQNAGFQFSDVFKPRFVFLGVLGGEHIHIAGADEQFVIEIRQAHAVVQHLGHFFDHGGELEQLHGRLFQGGVGIRIGNHVIQGLSGGFRQTLGHFDGSCAQTPGRVVDNPPQPQIVRPVVDDAQIGHHVLDLRPVEEPGAADNPVRNAVVLEGIFQSVGLGIRPVQNGKILEVTLIGARNDFGGHIAALCRAVGGLVDRNGIALAVGRPEPLALPA